MRKEITFDRFVRGCLLILGIAIVVMAINYLSSVLIPFFVAWVVAYLLYPIVTFLQYRCRLRSRLLSIFVTLILVCAAIYGIGYVIVPPMVEEMSHLKEVALRYLRQGAENSTIPTMIQHYVQTHANEFQVDKMLQTGELKEVLEKYVPKVWNVVWSTAGVVISIISSLIGLLYLFFLLTDDVNTMNRRPRPGWRCQQLRYRYCEDIADAGYRFRHPTLLCNHIVRQYVLSHRLYHTFERFCQTVFFQLYPAHRA